MQIASCSPKDINHSGLQHLEHAQRKSHQTSTTPASCDIAVNSESIRCRRRSTVEQRPTSSVDGTGNAHGELILADRLAVLQASVGNLQIV